MKVKIALIADIHGNLPAFKAIIADMRKQNIDRIIIAGDMITDCPDSNEILNIIRAMDVTVIKGNREQYYLDHSAGLKNHWNNTKQMSSLIWSFNNLSKTNRQFIKNLKDEAYMKINDRTLRIVHGSPDSNSELIFPLEKAERFKEIIDNLNEDILICGHSHEQWDYKSGTKYAVNPGSAGVHFNKNGGAEYSVMEIGTSQISVNHKQIRYSLEELKERFSTSGLYEVSPLWSESIIKSIKQGENLSMQLLDYAYELMENRGIGRTPTIPDEIWDQAGEEFLIKRD